MVVCIVPTGSGFVKNFQLVGTGGVYDSVKCLYRQGTWTNNKLNGQTVHTDFLNPIVNIKVGPYTSSQPNGTISEYTFSKILWNAFITNTAEGIPATKNVAIYASGSLTSTVSTASVNISGLVGQNLAGNVISFTFIEV